MKYEEMKEEKLTLSGIKVRLNNSPRLNNEGFIYLSFLEDEDSETGHFVISETKTISKDLDILYDCSGGYHFPVELTVDELELVTEAMRSLVEHVKAKRSQ